jgi:hypothetical protein
MMLAEVMLPSGAVMLVDGEAPSGPQDVGLKTSLDLERVRQTIAEFAETLIEPLRSLTPDEVEVELSFGLELGTGHVIAFFAGGHTQAGLKVRVKWKNAD